MSNSREFLGENNVDDMDDRTTKRRRVVSASSFVSLVSIPPILPRFALEPGARG